MTEKNKTILGLSISLIIFIFLFIIGFDTDVDSRIKRWTFGSDTLIGYFLIVIIRLSHSRVSPMSDLLNLTYYPLAITYLYFSWSKRKAIGNKLLNFIRNFYNKI